jgi:hypothetical protein
MPDTAEFCAFGDIAHAAYPLLSRAASALHGGTKRQDKASFAGSRDGDVR